MWQTFDGWVQDQGAPPLPDLEFIHTSSQLNLYVYPQVVDYAEARPLDGRWHRLDSSVRDTEAEFVLPDALAERPEGSRLIYLSLGSLGSADVALMRRLVELLSRTPHRFIVSMGPCHDDYDLADNMWGAEFVPQTRILPLVDLVITHGGNNTTVEALHYGKPMVVLPLFWDQYDNAQRMHETGYGVRLDPYTVTEQALHSAIERLLGDEALHTRLATVAGQIRARNGVGLAADLIERLGRSGPGVP
jgi:MGT family glycosyltransferase